MSSTQHLPEEDLLAPAVNADPYSYFSHLRESDPVHWNPVHRAWLVTRYADVEAGMKDKRLSSDRVRPLLDKLDDERRARMGPVLELMASWMVVSDAPAHTRLRKLAQGAFNPRRINAMEGRIIEVVDELLDEFIASGSQNFVEDFAFPLPAIVIAEVMGTPPEDRDRFREWSNQLSAVAFGSGGADRADRHAEAMQGLDELLNYFDGLIEHAKESPGEANMITGLLEGNGQGEVLDHEEMKAMCALMLFAGHETTTNLLSAMMLMLLQNPDQLELIREDRTLVRSAVEETLRYDGSIKLLHRWVTEDVELGGQKLAANERVFLVLSSANRDPLQFPDPEVVDVTRSPNAHVAFGKGWHTCIGAQLSRMEATAAWGQILDRLPGLRLVPGQELDWVPTLAARALREVRIEHDAKPAVS
jgi:cytochrome P450